MKKCVVICMMILVIILSTGCEDLMPSIPIADTNTSEADPTTTTDTTPEMSTDTTQEAGTTENIETNPSNDIAEEVTQNSEPVTETTEPVTEAATEVSTEAEESDTEGIDTANNETATNSEIEEEAVGHWELVDKDLVEHDDYESESGKNKEVYAMFDNMASCDSVNIQTGTGKELTETVASEVQWSEPDPVYLPDDVIHLLLSAEMVDFDRPKGGSNYLGVSIWAYTGSENTGYVTPKASNMEFTNPKNMANANIYDGEIAVKYDSVEATGTLGVGSDGSRRVIFIRAKLHSGGSVVAKYIYEYKTSALPVYDLEEPEEETVSEGHWKFKSSELQPTKYAMYGEREISEGASIHKYDSANILRTIVVPGGEDQFVETCLWTEPKSIYLPDEEISITIKAILTGASDSPIEELINKYNFENFYVALNIWAIIGSNESGHTMAYFTEKFTVFSENEITISGVFGPGKEGDVKTIEIRYAFPELGGKTYTYEYVLDE